MFDGCGEWQIGTPASSCAAVWSVAAGFIDYWNMVEQPLIMFNDCKISAVGFAK